MTLTEKQLAVARAIGTESAKAIMYPEKRDHYTDRQWLAQSIAQVLVTRERYAAITEVAADYCCQILTANGYAWNGIRWAIAA